MSHLEGPCGVNARPRDPMTFVDDRFVHDGCVVDVEALVQTPRLAVLSGLLSADECDALIAAARTLMEPSQVIDEHNIDTTAHDTRTSSGMHFPLGASRMADAVQRRIMSLVGLSVDRAEPLQVLRYGPGEEYVPHFDFFDVDDATGETGDGRATTVSRFGQRVATVICYLSVVESGGATVFPQVGFEIRPRPGRAVYFTYVDADGTVDPMSLHGGAPVHAGEKWILTQWCRERPYRAGVTASA